MSDGKVAVIVSGVAGAAIVLTIWVLNAKEQRAAGPTVPQKAADATAVNAELRRLQLRVRELEAENIAKRAAQSTQPTVASARPKRNEAKIEQAKKERRPEVGMTLEEWDALGEVDRDSCWHDRSGTTDEGDIYLLTHSWLVGVAPGQRHWSVVVDGDGSIKNWRVWTPRDRGN